MRKIIVASILSLFIVVAYFIGVEVISNGASSSMASTNTPSIEKEIRNKKFLGIDLNDLDFNPITWNSAIWNDKLEKRFERIGISKITSSLHVKGVGALDPSMVKCGNTYAEKMTFFENLEVKSIEVDGIISLKVGECDDLFKWTFLYLTKYDYKTEANKALYGKFILYDFKTQEECDKVFEKLLKKKYKAEKVNVPRYLGIQYIVVTVYNDPSKGNDKDSTNKRLKKIEKLDL